VTRAAHEAEGTTLTSLIGVAIGAAALATGVLAAFVPVRYLALG
jgi:hypothetical protein